MDCLIGLINFLLFFAVWTDFRQAEETDLRECKLERSFRHQQVKLGLPHVVFSVASRSREGSCGKASCRVGYSATNFFRRLFGNAISRGLLRKAAKRPKAGELNLQRRNTSRLGNSPWCGAVLLHMEDTGRKSVHLLCLANKVECPFRFRVSHGRTTAIVKRLYY